MPDTDDRIAEARAHIDPDKTPHSIFVANAHTDIAFLLAEVARLTRERDAAMGALKRIKAMSAVAGYDFGDATIHNVARQTIHAIETGAIHDQR